MATLLTVQFIVYAAAWLIGAYFLREAQRPALLWAGYCLLQAAGLALWTTLAPADASTLPPPAAMVMIGAYLCADIGLDLFVNGRVALARWWGALFVVIEGFLLAAWWFDAPPHVLAIAYNLGIAVLLGVPIGALARRFVGEFGHWAWLAMAPGLLMMALTLARTAMIVADPTLVGRGPSAVDNSALLTTTLVAAGAFNVCLLALIVGRLVQRLHRLVETDPLTEMVSRAGMERHLAAAWGLAARHGQPLSLAFVDLDDFKRLNDSAGHEAGDRMLKAVAGALRRGARTSDVVGRWGGDEFLVLMPHTDDAAAAAARARFEQGVKDTAASWSAPAGGAAHGSHGAHGAQGITVGTATRHAGDAGIEDLIARADAEMYARKLAKKQMLGRAAAD